MAEATSLVVLYDANAVVIAVDTKVPTYEVVE